MSHPHETHTHTDTHTYTQRCTLKRLWKRKHHSLYQFPVESAPAQVWGTGWKWMFCSSYTLYCLNILQDCIHLLHIWFKKTFFGKLLATRLLGGIHLLLTFFFKVPQIPSLLLKRGSAHCMYTVCAIEYFLHICLFPNSMKKMLCINVVRNAGN